MISRSWTLMVARWCARTMCSSTSLKGRCASSPWTLVPPDCCAASDSRTTGFSDSPADGHASPRTLIGRMWIRSAPRLRACASRCRTPVSPNYTLPTSQRLSISSRRETARTSSVPLMKRLRRRRLRSWSLRRAPTFLKTLSQSAPLISLKR